MYDLIYNFLITYLLSGSHAYLCEELGQILTHMSIVLIYIFLVKFIIWCFKLTSGLFHLRG